MTVCFLGGYSLSVCRTLLFLPFGSCKPSLCSMFSSSIPSSFLKGSCGKSCAAFIFPLLVTYFYVPIMNGLSKTPNTTTFTLVFYYIIMLFGAIAAQRRTNTESPSSIAPTAVRLSLLIVTVYYSLKNIYTSLSQSHL